MPERLAMIACTDMDDLVKEHPESEGSPLLKRLPHRLTVAPAARLPGAGLPPGI
jgi:hypothetical protein